jgi:hypothetical protein
MNLQHPGLMKVWKSPVFHFGILLVVVVVGLLLAPVMIDWNGYRSDLENYGRKLTGRAVTIEGPVSARLFPWPRLTAEKISIANPPGLAGPHFATAERITIRMTLAGLFRGGLDVESIEVAKPVFLLERRATGEGNWAFTPSADLIKSDSLSRVRLDQISLSGGTVTFGDWRRGEMLRLEDFNASLASPGVAGPWRMRSQALYNGMPVEISVNTAAYAAGEPFRFGVKAAAADGSGYTFGFDGGLMDGKTEGEVRIEPASAGEEKTDAEGRLRPLLFTAKLAGDFDRLAFQDVEVSRLEPGQTGAITTGSATLQFGSTITASFDLKAAMLDVDTLAGAQSRDVLRQAGSLGVVSSLISLLPPAMKLDGKLDVSALKMGGQDLDNVELAIAAERDSLSITRVAAGLPGRSRMLFSGLFEPGRSGPELNGTLALETSDLRELSFWLWPQGREGLGKLWTGDRGRLKMESAVSLTAAETRLSTAEFELDGERGRGSLTVTSAGQGAVDLSLEGRRFDLDAYAPQGIPTFAVARDGAAGSLLALAVPRPDAPNVSLRFIASEVLLNAVTAKDVRLDLKSGATGLDLHALEIGAVGGARVAASGLVLDTGKGADGKIDLEVQADDPSGLIRLLGLGGSNGLPPWATGLGATEVSASLVVKPAAQGSELRFMAQGNSGELNIDGQGTASSGGELSGNLKVAAPRSGRILALLGLSGATTADNEAGTLWIEAAGTRSEGFITSATLQVHGARFEYRGNANPWAEGFGMGGQFSLRASDGASLLAASGFPASVPPGGMSGEARIAWGGGQWTFEDVAGSLGNQAFSGSASLLPSGEGELRLETGPLILADVLAASFLEWSGSGSGLETGFAAELPFGLTGRITVVPSALQVLPHFEARDASVVIDARPGEIRLAMYGKDKDGRDARLELASTGADDSRKISGQLSLPTDLGQQLALINGAQVAAGEGSIDMRFESAGRSPAGALAAMLGEGNYRIDGLRLVSLTPQDFATALAQSKDATAISSAFERLRAGAGMDFGAVSGAITVAEGQARFAPITRQDAAFDIDIKTIAELALGQIDIDIGLRLKLRDDLPPMSVSYAGPASLLARSEDNSELATALGVTIMQQGLDELERLQQEQIRLAAEEEKLRIEDEARLQAFYAQRDEVLLRRRELKVHAEMQVARADRLRRQIEAERTANASINKAEARQRLREVRVWRRLARLAAASQAAAPEAAPQQPEPPRQSDPANPAIQIKPPAVPVVIAPSPGSSPSQ